MMDQCSALHSDVDVARYFEAFNFIEHHPRLEIRTKTNLVVQ